MTLLVVHQNVVYIDRFTAIADSADSACKVIEMKGVKYACAGCGDVAHRAMFELSRATSWFETVKSVMNDADGTYIVARIDGELYVLDLSVPEPRFSPALPPNASGLQHMAGSGWKFFHAYFREHSDVHKAMVLAGAYCRDVTSEYDTF